MNKNSVVLDIDNCLADFEGAFCKKFGWNHRELVRLESRYPELEYEIGWYVDNPTTYTRLDIIDFGVKIARFCQNEKFDIHVVSSRPANTETITARWLKQNKIPYSYLSVVSTFKFHVIERIQPVFIVDDLLGVVEPCAEVGIPSFLIDHPWNQKENLDGIIHRIRNFDEFLAKFTQFFDI